MGSLEDAGRDVEGSDGLVVLCGEDDPATPGCAPARDSAPCGCTPYARALGGPLSQVVEVPETRAALRHEVLGGLAEPLLLLRVGWQAISRSHLVPTPRRPLDQVLLP